MNGVHLNKPEDDAYEKSLKLYPEDQDDCYERTRLNLERQKQSVLEQNEDNSLVAEIIVSHAFFVTGVTAIFDPSQKLHYAEFCAMTAYRLSKDVIDDSEPDWKLILKEFDDYVRTKADPVF